MEKLNEILNRYQIFNLSFAGTDAFDELIEELETLIRHERDDAEVKL